MITREHVLEVLRSEKARLFEKYGLTAIGVFGSVARNEQHEDSDIDIVIEMEHPDIYKLSRLREELQAILGNPVDLVRKHQDLRPLFKKRLQRDTLYA